MINKLKSRSNSMCELCSSEENLHVYIVSPEDQSAIDNMVCTCQKCFDMLSKNNFEDTDHWRCLNGSVWSEFESVQALSYRILDKLKDQYSWANEIIENLYLDQKVIDWALYESNIEKNKIVHKDAYSNILLQGDNVVLIENLNVKGTSYIAPKGTQVKKIKLVHDNADQIEGKINGDTIVILTKFVKKGV